MLETLLNAGLNMDINTWLFLIYGLMLMSGIGLPMPEEIPLFFLSILYYQGQIYGPFWIIIAILCVSLADFCLYNIGRYLGLKIFEHPFFKRNFKESSVQKVNHYIHRFGYKVVILGRLILGVRSAIFLSAGILHMRRDKFILYDLIASTLSVCTFMFFSSKLLKKFDGELILVQETLKKYQSSITYGIFGLALIFIGILMYKALKLKYNNNSKS